MMGGSCLKKNLDRDIPLDLLAQLKKGIRNDAFGFENVGKLCAPYLSIAWSFLALI
jgi:hypothetical protein